MKILNTVINIQHLFTSYFAEFAYKNGNSIVQESFKL